MKPTISIVLVLFLLGNSQLRAQQGIQWYDEYQDEGSACGVVFVVAGFKARLLEW